MSHHRFFHAVTLAAVALAASVTSAVVPAQSLDKNAPAPLQAGINSGQVDSLIGKQYWYLWVGPGSFEVRMSQGSAQGFAAQGQAKYMCGFVPPVPGAKVLQRTDASGFAFVGSAPTRARLEVGIEPPNSTLVRSTVPYTITGSGSVSYDPPPNPGTAVVGMYNSFLGQVSGREPLGATRFNGDGTVETASGVTGTWKLFDQQTGTFVVTIAGQRLSLKLDPGRGLIDANGNVTFARAH